MATLLDKRADRLSASLYRMQVASEWRSLCAEFAKGMKLWFMVDFKIFA